MVSKKREEKPCDTNSSTIREDVAPDRIVSDFRALSPPARGAIDHVANPPDSGVAKPDMPVGADQEKTRFEVQKLNEEINELREKRRWPVLVRAAIPALLISLGTGIVGYFFGDSLQARNRADIRKATMDRYFSVDNDLPGKRKQMLVFIQRYLAKDDPELMKWVRDESAVVDDQLANLKAQIATLEADVKSLKNELAKMETSRNQIQTERDSIASELEKRQKALREGYHSVARRPPPDLLDSP